MNLNRLCRLGGFDALESQLMPSPPPAIGLWAGSWLIPLRHEPSIKFFPVSLWRNVSSLNIYGVGTAASAANRITLRSMLFDVFGDTPKLSHNIVPSLTANPDCQLERIAWRVAHVPSPAFRLSAMTYSLSNMPFLAFLMPLEPSGVVLATTPPSLSLKWLHRQYFPFWSCQRQSGW